LKTVAYVIPAQEYEDLKFMVKEEDKHLSFMADEAMKE